MSLVDFHVSICSRRSILSLPDVLLHIYSCRLSFVLFGTSSFVSLSVLYITSISLKHHIPEASSLLFSTRVNRSGFATEDRYIPAYVTISEFLRYRRTDAISQILVGLCFCFRGQRLVGILFEFNATFFFFFFFCVRFRAREEWDGVVAVFIFDTYLCYLWTIAQVLRPDGKRIRNVRGRRARQGGAESILAAVQVLGHGAFAQTFAGHKAQIDQPKQRSAK